ncbi:MAG: transglycosylase domain-containing protein, partial [Candidatus Sulfotelmatobacter sp.]
MAIKIKIPKRSGEGKKKFGSLPRDPLKRAALVVLLVAATGFTGWFCYYYIKYERIITQRFRTPIFANSAKIYAMPEKLSDGEKADAKEIAGELRSAGYSDAKLTNKDNQSPLGTFRLMPDGIEVTPGPESYHSPEEARITIADGQITRIASNGSQLSAYELEPQLVTSLSDSAQRSKRQVVKYNEIPKVMVDAVLAIEDRRFFEHGGVNFVRMFEAGWVDLLRQKHEQG